MLRKVGILIISLTLWVQGSVAQAGPLQDYYEAQKLFVFAAACRAAYNDRLGQIALNALVNDGWHVSQYRKVGDAADARLLLANKDMTGTGQEVYLLATTGTETMKDVLTDFMVDKVYFFGHTPEEMIANAEKKAAPPDTPMVHRGFFNYVKTALTIPDPADKRHSKGLLFDDVVGNPDRKIYLVGHSLGGAAATVSAAALISFGAKPDQLEVITFGAPAVGDAAFRSQYEKKINLTRYVMRGDMITGVLQGLGGGYVQSGREVNLPVPEFYTNDSHEMALYLDYAIKNYYRKRDQAIEAGVLPVPPDVVPSDPKQPYVYVSPVINNLPGPIAGEFYYMKEALYDEYRELFPAYVFAGRKSQGDPLAGALRTAAAAGCQWLVVPEFQGIRLRNDSNSYQVVFQQTVYRVNDGALISMETYSSSTKNLTPVEAGIHAVMEMRAQKAPWLKPVE